MLPSKSAFHLLFLLPKSSFGSHKVDSKSQDDGSMLMCLSKVDSKSQDDDSILVCPSNSHDDDVNMHPCYRACMPAVLQSVHASRVKERAHASRVTECKITT